MSSTSEHRVESHYSHASIPHHVDDLHKQAENPQAQREGTGEQALPRQGVIFDSSHVRLLLEAIGDPNHPLRQQAERAVGGFAEVAEKRKGISANSASREFNAPTTFFLTWAKQYDAIPILSEGKGQGSAIILDREKARQAAELYHEAKQQRIQPRKLLNRMSSNTF
jgi:hypothetical protein